MIRRLLVLVSGALWCVPAIVSAHAFGISYTLPLPVSFYVLGGAGAFLASCAIIAIFFSDPVHKDASRVRTIRLPHWNTTALHWIGLGGFVLTLMFAFFGGETFATNPAPALFWMVFLTLFLYLSAIVDGLWDAVNPFRTLAQMIVRHRSPIRRYPVRLGYVPAIALLLAIAWLEILSSGLGSDPFVVGSYLLTYAIISCLGSLVYGVHAWFTYVDVFSVIFRIVGKMAPVQLREHAIEISAPGRLATHEAPTRMGETFFILTILASTALDGLLQTRMWYDAASAIQSYLPLMSRTTVDTVGFLLLPIVFFALYAAAVYAMRVLTRTRESARSLILRFTYSLVPIMIVYHMAHYADLAMTELPRLAAIASDPFARGWDLWGTAHSYTDAGLFRADLFWYFQFIVIVAGHVAAAIIAHQIARRVFGNRYAVLRSQIPMIALMVFYTAFGLWILAQPYATGV